MTLWKKEHCSLKFALCDELSTINLAENNLLHLLKEVKLNFSEIAYR